MARKQTCFRPSTPIEIGKAEVLRNFSAGTHSLASSDGERAGVRGLRVALFALGNMQRLARQTAEQLTAEGCDVALINPRFFKPLDTGCHEFFGRGADVVATLEDHVLMGGYGSAVLELFSEKGITTPLVRLGWPDKFIEHATTVDTLRERHGLTAAALVARIKESLAGTAVKALPVAATA